MPTANTAATRADGGSRGNPGPAGYGAVVLDADTGEVLAERAASLGRTTNNVAEYNGLLAGLRAAAELDPASVAVRMDSKLVIEQMSGRWRVKHPDLQPLHAEGNGLVGVAGTEEVAVHRMHRTVRIDGAHSRDEGLGKHLAAEHPLVRLPL